MSLHVGDSTQIDSQEMIPLSIPQRVECKQTILWCVKYVVATQAGRKKVRRREQYGTCGRLD